ncbi:NHL repeat-containing protein [Candidatus Binatus sp.]|jgi:sugar lactone lactonase YvrE|uniref:NHL repeat-containing protein n=4 Tax=Candidatus Binatus sp. TaxID=2811406 RepID=UPI003C59359E
MKASWGKARIGAIAIFCAVALAMVGLHRFSGRAYSQSLPPIPPLFVADACTDAVTAYPAASNGDIAPLAPVPTGLAEPESVAIDANGNIYVTNRCTNAVTIYAKGSSGDAAPIAIIGGPNTGLYAPAGIAVDSSGKIYVAAYPFTGGGTQVGNVFIYPALGSSTGLLNEAPIATISGSTTGLSEPYGIALDSSRNIYVTGYNTNTGYQSVSVYPALGSSTGLLDEAPIATISGNNGNITGLNEPVGIALDSSQNIYVVDNGATSVFVYPALGSSTGTLIEAPIATISGNITGLDSPKNIALDSSQNIYVTDDGATSVFVYPALGSSTGVLNENPTATISGSNTDLQNPYGIAVDSSGIYVADEKAESVFVYSALGSNTGLLNEAPSSGTISTTLTTGLAGPVGMALDTVGNIYVAGNDFNGVPGVFVYAAGSNANAAPIATISGNTTGLVAPSGIALDSSANIYVTDEGDAGDDIPPSVFVYPALGSSTGLLDEAPIATISGSKTDLLSPGGIALDSSRNIYVADNEATSVFVYAALGSSTGTLDDAPLATIGGSSTGLRFPNGIALDSSDQIYVADILASKVFVYPALGSSTGKLDEVPSATISGHNTGLRNPYGIALDSSGNIYVADVGAASVFVYPALAISGTGLLDEAPTDTISGPLTELGDPLFVAIQPAVAPTPTPSATATGATPTATATATQTATPTGTPTPTTTLSASPAKLNLGSVDATGTSKSKKVSLTNKGAIAAVIGSVTATPPFVVAGGENTCSGQTIAPKKKCSFEVEFAPATPGAVSDQTIEVGYNGASPAMNLSGNGIAVTLKAPSKETFSSVAAGTSGKAKKIKISNPATVSVNLATTSVVGTDSGAFTITANTCTVTLKAKPGNCTITMEFAPKSGATGTQSATVGFSYTYGANAGVVSIPISGTVK